MTREQLCFDVFDGQAYGPRDNLVPRDWQMECVSDYRESVTDWYRDLAKEHSVPHTFCVYAGTGTGKTKAVGLMAAFLLNASLIEQVVIVCPNRSIRNKTKKEFFRYFGIEVVRFHKIKHSSGIPRMQQGYILTYAALMNDPTLHRRLCQSARTLVVFDEIHHLGDSNGWGEGAMEAFGNVSYVIALTGTPYRSDNTRIPFVTYEEAETNGIVRFQPNYTYSLGRAVADGVCRMPLFNFHRGVVLIRSLESGEMKVTFDDNKVNQSVASERLRGAVRYGSSDRRGMLDQALKKCRDEKRKVIIFLGGDTEGDHTPTQDATVFLPDELQELGYGPDEYEIVTGDDDAAQQKIEDFGTDEKKWILVSINMISEGTDIPELSAAIFLTSITAKQTTVQRIGRVLRLMGESDCHKDAIIFMFRDKNLVDLSDEIKTEVDHEVILLRKRRDPNTEGTGGGERKFRTEAIGIGDGKLQVVKFNGREWPVDLFEDARQRVKEKGLPATMLNAVLHLEMSR